MLIRTKWLTGKSARPAQIASSEKLTRSLKSTESGAGAQEADRMLQPPGQMRKPHHYQSQRRAWGSWGGSRDPGCQFRTTGCSGPGAPQKHQP